MMDTSQNDRFSYFCPIPSNPLHMFSHPEFQAQSDPDQFVYGQLIPTDSCRSGQQTFPVLGESSKSAIQTAQSQWPGLSATSEDPRSCHPAPLILSESPNPPPPPPIKRMPPPIPRQPPPQQQTNPPVLADTLNKLEIFRILDTKPVAIHPSRESILRNNLRHLPFTFRDWPRQKIVDRAKRSSSNRQPQRFTGQSRNPRVVNPTNGVPTEVAIEGSTDSDVSTDEASDDEQSDPTDLRRIVGRSLAGRRWQSRREHQTKRLHNTKPNLNTPFVVVRGYDRSRERESSSGPSSSHRDRSADTHRPHGAGSSKRTQQQTPVAPKKVGSVSLPTVAHWASELGTFKYLFDSHKMDEEGANRLGRLLDHIDSRKRDVSSHVMKVVGPGLVAKLQFFKNCTAFGDDCKAMAQDIVDYWTAAGLVSG